MTDNFDIWVFVGIMAWHNTKEKTLSFPPSVAKREPQRAETELGVAGCFPVV